MTGLKVCLNYKLIIRCFKKYMYNVYFYVNITFFNHSYFNFLSKIYSEMQEKYASLFYNTLNLKNIAYIL